MVDGQGNFLPESKRGLPTPWVAFYKIFGLAKIFPKSKKFGKYHLTYLDKDQTHQVEILSGAFMFMRKNVLDQIGLLDEDYFMYGEDIDLSYRILKGGYKNYYLANTRIIHYKGESTKKTSVNYVFVFYKAMIIFAQKHFSSNHAGLFTLLINLAIYLRAFIAIITRFLKQAILPLMDASVIFIGMYFLKTYWEENHKWVPGKYPTEYMTIAVPAYVLIWLYSVFFSGGYDKPIKLSRIVTGVAFGTLLISALSNFVDAYRFSKALIILGGIFSVIAIALNRFALHFLKYKNFNLEKGKTKRVVLIGNGAESKRVIKLLQEMNLDLNILGYLSTYKVEGSDHYHLGHLSQIQEIIKIYNIDEIIFCSKDIPANEIIEWMTQINSKIIEFKIVPDESNYIIGSNSKDRQGDFYTLNIELNIVNQNNRRKKRLLDVLLSSLFILSWPFIFWTTTRPGQFLLNALKVFVGKYSWVGFSENTKINLPKIKKGIISPVTYISEEKINKQTIQRLNLLYAKEYNLYTDVELIFRSWKVLGNRGKN
jgi:hypothetical protein